MRFIPRDHAHDIERFWKRVDKSGPGECWSWTGAVVSPEEPYGLLRINDVATKATHISIEIATGKPFPKGMCACHNCDNPNCVNPKHLFIATHSENMADCIKKGRHAWQKVTHCRQGHLLVPHKNPSLGTKRKCVECQKERSRLSQLKAKAMRMKLGVPSRTPMAIVRARLAELDEA